MKKENILKKIFLNFYDNKKVMYIVKQETTKPNRFLVYLGDVKGSRIEKVKCLNRTQLKENLRFLTDNDKNDIKQYFYNV